MTDGKRIRMAILKVLRDLGAPAGAARIVQRLASAGAGLQPRTIRVYLLQMDRDGLTRRVSRRKGREITVRGREELEHGNVMERVGFIATRIHALSYRMTFRRSTEAGTLIANVAVINPAGLKRAIEYMYPVFKRNLGMGNRLAIAWEGDVLAGQRVPKGMVGLATVCSVTVNGIMLSERIPVTVRYGGLVEMRDWKPLRFVQLIDYHGTTVDPLEFFISAGMTSVRECSRTGSGLVGASFREIPVAALDEALEVRKALNRLGLGGILEIGKPNQPLLDLPVAEGSCGMIVMGGLNPVAAMREAGIKPVTMSLAGLQDYSSFKPFTFWREQILK